MEIKILGSGCKNCKLLEENVRIAVAELGLSATIEKVQNIDDIIGYGVMRTPAIVVDDNVLLFGKVATVAEIKALLS